MANLSNLTITEKEEEARRVLLETCEKKIFSAFRRGMEATRAIAKELITIDDQQLYLVGGYSSLQDYVDGRLNLSYRSATRLMDIQRTMDVLEEHKIERLPYNESQAAELSRLPVEMRPEIWTKTIEICEENQRDLTAYAVRSAVEATLQAIRQNEAAKPKQPAPRPRARGVDIPLDDSGPGNGTEPEKRSPFSEEGEKALDRIRRLCGDSVADSIENGTIQITENQVIRWAEEETDTVKNLAYYIVDLRWTFPRALNYEHRIVDGQTTIDELMTLTRARGGHVSFHHADFRISIEHIAQAAA